MISVIIPAYNCVQYITKCLDSVLSQQYRDLDIIVIDDGSNDGTEAVVERYANDSRVRIIHQRNKGSSIARNVGLDISSGEWISFVDADDWIDSRFYSDALRVASITACDVLMCGIYINGVLQYSQNQFTKNRDDILISLLNRRIPCRIMNKLYRRETIGEVRFNDKRNLYEDGPWSAKVLSRCTGLACIPSGYYRYRNTPFSQSRQVCYRTKQLAEFWSNKIERDIIIFSNLANESNRIAIKPKLIEHYSEACELALKVNCELLNTQLAVFSALLY